MTYCSDLFNYRRRVSSLVHVGDLSLGGDNPIRLQSMTNTPTLDTSACVEQAARIVEAGGEIVRLTAQGVRQAENLAEIRAALRAEGIQAPLVADIHFNPKAAEAAATRVEKVRINPGNFADPMFIDESIKDEAERRAFEIEKVRERLVPFLALCKQQHTAIRIGVNHGSLSARMMNRYGDTPQGMVASCMEYLRICVEEDFHDVVISVKASNPMVMVQTVRLLVETMQSENMFFPLHLGVTEAGDGEDGRIKSAVGIAALLNDGIGDTIRVSLSEAPEVEIPVAKKLRDYILSRNASAEKIQAEPADVNPFSFHRRESIEVGLSGGDCPPVVIADCSAAEADPALFTKNAEMDLSPDFIYVGSKSEAYADTMLAKSGNTYSEAYPVFGVEQMADVCASEARYAFLKLCYTDLSMALLEQLKSLKGLVLLLYSRHGNAPAEMRAAFHRLIRASVSLPVVICRSYNTENGEDFQLESAADCGPLFLDGFGDGILLQAPAGLLTNSVRTAFGILQAARRRISKTEYISCPACGRTLFDLQQTLAKLKAATSHLKGLKIAVMGCIVNGPGEMADADYGYVGAGKGRISLYKGKTCVEKNIPEAEAVEHLLALIQKAEPKTTVSM